MFCLNEWNFIFKETISLRRPEKLNFEKTRVMEYFIIFSGGSALAPKINKDHLPTVSKEWFLCTGGG